jgi:hypothetical protein
MVEGSSDSAASSGSRPGYRRTRSQNGQGQPRVSFSDSGQRSPNGSAPAGPASLQPSRSYAGRNTLYTIPSEPSNSQLSLTPETPIAAGPQATASSPNARMPASRLESVPELRTQSLLGAAEMIAASDRQPSKGARDTNTAKRRSESPASIIQESPTASKSKKGGVLSKMLGSSTSASPLQQPAPSSGKSTKHGAALGSSMNGKSDAVGWVNQGVSHAPSGAVAATTNVFSKHGRAAEVAKPNGKPHNGSMTDLISPPVLDRCSWVLFHRIMLRISDLAPSLAATTERMNPAIQNGHKPVRVDVRRLSSGYGDSFPLS